MPAAAGAGATRGKTADRVIRTVWRQQHKGRSNDRCRRNAHECCALTSLLWEVLTNDPAGSLSVSGMPLRSCHRRDAPKRCQVVAHNCNSYKTIRVCDACGDAVPARMSVKSSRLPAGRRHCQHDRVPYGRAAMTPCATWISVSPDLTRCLCRIGIELSAALFSSDLAIAISSKQRRLGLAVTSIGHSSGIDADQTAVRLRWL